MLNRRRILMMCGGGFRWIKAKISLFVKTWANLGFAQAVKVTLSRSTKTNHTADLSVFDSDEMNADTKVGNSVDAQLAQVNATEITTNKKVGVSVVARLIGYLRAPIEYLEKIRIAHTAELEQADANEVSAAVNFKSDYHANGESAETNSAVIDITIPQPKATATATFGAAQMAGLQIMPKMEHTAALSWWIYPEKDENGRLLIRQVYGATQTETGIEVI